jgi:hypothetical protein
MDIKNSLANSIPVFPHHLFQRNVSIALSRVQKFSDQAKQI